METLDELERLTPNLDVWYDRCTLAATNVTATTMKHLPEGGVFVDVGANVGVVTAAALAKGATVYAFEPVPVYAAYTQRRFPEARVYEVALGEAPDRRLMWCDDTNLGWNTLTSEMTSPGMSGVNVRVMPLDLYPNIHPDVMKIDTEGWEWAVIRGGHRTIETHRPVIVVEIGWGTNHPRRDEVVAELEWLFSIGYQRVPYDVEDTRDFLLVP